MDIVIKIIKLLKCSSPYQETKRAHVLETSSQDLKSDML